MYFKYILDPVFDLTFSKYQLLSCRDLENKRMMDKLMYIPNNITQNYPFCKFQLVVERLDTHINKPTNKKVSPTFLCQPIRKRYHKTLWTNVINSPMPPPHNFGLIHIYFTCLFLVKKISESIF